MKKVFVWIQVIVLSILLLIFSLMAIAILLDRLLGGTSEFSNKELIISLLGNAIVLYFIVLGLKNGINKLKREKEIEHIAYDKDLNIDLNGRIQYKDYRNLIFGLTFNKPLFLFAGLMLLLSLVYNLYLEENVINYLKTNYSILLVLIIVFIFPIIVLIQIKKAYNSTQILNESFEYTLDNESIHIKGHMIESTQSWSRFYQMRETKKFFMFYENTTIAVLLNKDMFSDRDLIDFKDFVRSLNIKKV